uniref:Unconventional prefoldin RPB5 interactor n=1 Tax=Ornithodoros turicata TaxID=34597 RepID=A0A2R5L712_9ACAR
MEQPPVEKLLSWQERELKKCDEKLERWAQFESDYKHLHDRLSTIADKVSHEVMVPLNSMAFMPGRLIHTNEILVLLGDNWFAVRSAKQAQGIVERRLAHCRAMQTELHKERDQYLKWMKFTGDLCDKGEYVDIREPYDQAEEAAWREKHRQSLQEYHKNKYATSKDDGGDQQIWEMLNRLELQEENELASSENEGSRKVRWQDESSGQIEFSYIDSSVSQPEETSAGDIVSPGDILKAFGGLGSGASKSILKTVDVCDQPSPSKERADVPPAPKEVANVSADPEYVVGKQEAKVAFTGAIVEHGASATSEATLDIDVAEIEVPQSLAKPKSLFKSRKGSKK